MAEIDELGSFGCAGHCWLGGLCVELGWLGGEAAGGQREVPRLPIVPLARSCQQPKLNRAPHIKPATIKSFGSNQSNSPRANLDNYVSTRTQHSRPCGNR